MKKILFVLLLTTLSLAHTFALDITDKKNLCTVMGGITINTMDYRNNTADKRGAKVGGMAGFSFEHRFKHVAAFEIQALYVNKGTQSVTDNALFKTTNRLNLHSVEFPVLVKFYLGKRKIFNINVGGFASYSFYTQFTARGKNKINNEEINNKSKNLTSNSNNPKDASGQKLLRPYDAGIVAGFEFVSKIGLGAGARVSQGFIDFTNPKFNGPVLLDGLIYDDDSKKVWHTGVQLYALFKF